MNCKEFENYLQEHDEGLTVYAICEDYLRELGDVPKFAFTPEDVEEMYWSRSDVGTYDTKEYYLDKEEALAELNKSKNWITKKAGQFRDILEVSYNFIQPQTYEGGEYIDADWEISAHWDMERFNDFIREEYGED